MERRGATLAAILAIAAASCNTIFDIDVELQAVTLTADYGAAQGTVPAVPCAPSTASACGTGAQLGTAAESAAVSVAPACDAATSTCFAQANVQLVQQVNVLQDDGFASRVARGSITLVRSVDIGYAMPVDTLTFDIPDVAVYVGPGDAKSAGDPGVVMVDTIPGVAAGTTFTDRRHLTIPDGSEAANLLKQNVRDRTPFVFILVTTPRIDAGDPAPAGALEIDLYPTVNLGLD
jgi:hypothetical protein